MRKSLSAGGVVVNAKGEICVVNQNNDSWSLPKGHVESGETELETARREIAEESGIKNLTLIKTLPSYERFRVAKDGGDDKAELKTIHMFLFTTNDTKLEPRDPANPEARWVPKEEVCELLTHEKDREFFESILFELENLNINR